MRTRRDSYPLKGSGVAIPLQRNAVGAAGLIKNVHSSSASLSDAAQKRELKIIRDLEFVLIKPVTDWLREELILYQGICPVHFQQTGASCLEVPGPGETWSKRAGILADRQDDCRLRK
jgi:hypothetical protein